MQNTSIALRLQNAKKKLLGVHLWNKMLVDINTFGSGSQLFDARHVYKANLGSVLEHQTKGEDFQNDLG